MAFTSIQSESKNGVLVVRFAHHELTDQQNPQQIGQELQTAAGLAESHQMLVNFDGVEYLTSTISSTGQVVVRKASSLRALPGTVS